MTTTTTGIPVPGIAEEIFRVTRGLRGGLRRARRERASAMSAASLLRTGNETLQPLSIRSASGAAFGPPSAAPPPAAPLAAAPPSGVFGAPPVPFEPGAQVSPRG